VQDFKFPIIVSGSAIQSTLFAALRLLAVLIGGATAIMGFVGKRDLSGLIAYVQSSDFTAVAGALAALFSAAYGLYATYNRKRELVEVEKVVPNSLVAKVDAKPSDTVMRIVPFLAVLLLAGAATGLGGCATTAQSVRLNSGKAFLTAQLALKSAQQSTLAVCRVPAPRLVEPCRRAIDVLHTGAQAEAAGFTAQQAGNAADLQASILILTNLPAQLAALGVLEAN